MQLARGPISETITLFGLVSLNNETRPQFITFVVVLDKAASTGDVA